MKNTSASFNDAENIKSLPEDIKPILLSHVSCNTIMENTSTLFNDTIRTLLVNFDYDTVESLAKINQTLAELPEDIKVSNKAHIDMIACRIKGFNSLGPNLLTNRQIRSLENVLKEILFGKPKKIPCASISWDSLTPQVYVPTQNYNSTEENHTKYGYRKIYKKLNQDDIMNEVLVNFADIVGNPNILSSTITTEVLNILSILESVAETDPNLYVELEFDIRQILTNHKWNNGFFSQPNGQLLSEDIWKLIDNHF